MTDGAEATTTDAPPHVVSKSPDQVIPDGSVNSEAVAARLKEVEAREGAVKEQHARNQEEKGKEAKQQEALRIKVGRAAYHNLFARHVMPELVMLSSGTPTMIACVRCYNGLNVRIW